jgi:hypothetical protein
MPELHILRYQKQGSKQFLKQSAHRQKAVIYFTDLSKEILPVRLPL